LTGKRLEGAKIEVAKLNGEIVGTYVTDKLGVIQLPDLDDGWYQLTEIKAPKGYLLDSTPQKVEVKKGETKTFEFENKVTGGHISAEFIGPIEAGVKEAMESGVLAGFPVVGVKATVTDGQMHPVDSSEMAFKLAGSMCFKEAAPKAKPVILEPIMKVEVRTPEEYMGEVIGDLNQRRGNIQSMTDGVGVKVIDAKVPLSEMFGYIGDLRSKTQGRAMFTMEMDSYDEVPKSVSEEIIKAQRGE